MSTGNESSPSQHSLSTDFGAGGMFGFSGPSGEGHSSSLLGGGPGLGAEYLLNASGALAPAQSASGHGGGASGSTSTSSVTPSPTLVGAAGGLRIDLIWDASVAKAPTGFVQAIIAAAQEYTTMFATNEQINIDVGYGEIAGSALEAGALGESEDNGYLVNYSTVLGALKTSGDPAGDFATSNAPTSSQFFVSSAESKALGLVSANSTSIDGYVGFSSQYPMFTGTSGSVPSGQYDLMSIAEHEISEVMGRIGIEGASLGGAKTYTPLDLFNYASPGKLELSGAGGYYSNNDGASNLGVFNDAARYGGDIADWSSSVPDNSYDAFTSAGSLDPVTANDLLEMASLGYKLSTAGIAAA